MCEIMERIATRERKDERKKLLNLSNYLVRNGRFDDLERANEDDDFLEELLKEFDDNNAALV